MAAYPSFKLEIPPLIAAHHFTPGNAEIHERMLMERFILWNTFRLMDHLGWRVTGIDDGEGMVVPQDPRWFAVMMDDVFSVDECRIRWVNPGVHPSRATAHVVLGNDGYDALADMTSGTPLEVIDGEDWVNLAKAWAFMSVMTAVTLKA